MTFSKGFELREGEIKILTAKELKESQNAEVARNTVVGGEVSLRSFKYI